MLLEFVSKKAVIQETKVDINVSILEKTTFLHYKYSGGYDYFVKFVPSFRELRDKKVYKLDFLYMDDDKAVKGQLEINPFDRFPEVRYISDKKEFEYVGSKKLLLSNDYLAIIINYWLLQKRCDDCFFTVITEEQFNEEKENFFLNFFG